MFALEGANPKVNVRCVDLGGQETYYATHKFFFAKRATYVLVWAERNGGFSQVESYVRTIRTRVPDANIIVALTHVEKFPEPENLGPLLDQLDAKPNVGPVLFCSLSVYAPHSAPLTSGSRGPFHPLALSLSRSPSAPSSVCAL